MHHRKMVVTMLAGALVMSASPLWAATQETTKEKIQTQSQEQERIYGSQLMTDEERNEYRERMRSATTAEEREKIRAEHHERMAARAKERGVTIPDEPPMKGGGMGPGAGGMGPGGMGPGGRMGPGGGMGPGTGQGGGPRR